MERLERSDLQERGAAKAYIQAELPWIDIKFFAESLVDKLHGTVSTNQVLAKLSFGAISYQWIRAIKELVNRYKVLTDYAGKNWLNLFREASPGVKVTDIAHAIRAEEKKRRLLPSKINSTRVNLHSNKGNIFKDPEKLLILLKILKKLRTHPFCLGDKKAYIEAVTCQRWAEYFKAQLDDKPSVHSQFPPRIAVNIRVANIGAKANRSFVRTTRDEFKMTLEKFQNAHARILALPIDEIKAE